MTALLLREAHAEITAALELPLEGNAKAVFAGAKARFGDAKVRMEANVPRGFLDAPPVQVP
jgi:hypothetical protein